MPDEDINFDIKLECNPIWKTFYINRICTTALDLKDLNIVCLYNEGICLCFSFL